VRGACHAARARRREDCGGQIHVDAQRRGLRHDCWLSGLYSVTALRKNDVRKNDVSDLTLEAVEESCAFGEDCVLIGLR